MDRRSLLKLATAGVVVWGSNPAKASRDENGQDNKDASQIKISSFMAPNVRDDEAISKALSLALSASCNQRVVVNDLQRPLIVNSRHVFDAGNSSLRGVSEFNKVGRIGLIGSFILCDGGGFDFIGCQFVLVDVLISGGEGNSIDDVAIRMESGCVGVSFKILGNQYQGTLYGTLGSYNKISKSGVQCVDDSSISAFSCGRAFYISGTTGFGTISTVWEEFPIASSVIIKSSDVTIGVYENFIPSQDVGCLTIEDCGSITFGSLATGAWGQPQVKVIRTQTLAIGNHLAVLGNKDKNENDVFAMDVIASVVSIGNSRLEKLGSGFRVGGGGTLNLSNLTANFVNQLVYLGFDFSKEAKLRTAYFNASNIAVQKPNSNQCMSDKDLIVIDENVTFGRLIVDNMKVDNFSYKRAVSSSLILDCKTPSDNFNISINISLENSNKNKNYIYVRNIASLKRFLCSGYDGEVKHGKGETIGHGQAFTAESENPKLNAESKLLLNLNAKIRLFFNVSPGGDIEILINNSMIFCKYDAGKSSCVVDLLKGDHYQIRVNKVVILDSTITYFI